MLATVPPIKTPLGQQELRRRTAGLGQRHRTLLFLIDGRRPLSEVLVLGHKAGAATSHLEDLIRLGFVDVPALHPAPAAQPAPPPVPDRDVPPVVTYVELEVPAGPMRSQWGTLDAEALVPVPAVKVLEEPTVPDVVADALDEWPGQAEVEVPAGAAADERPNASAAPAALATTLPVDVAPAIAPAVEPERLTEPETSLRQQTLFPAVAPAAVPVASNEASARPQRSIENTVVQPPAQPALAHAHLRVTPAVARLPVPVPTPTEVPAPVQQALPLLTAQPAEPAAASPAPPLLQRMALMARRAPARPKDPLEEARESLLKVIKCNRTTVARRLRPAVVNASSENTLIDVVWELERDLTHGQRSHEGLIALQRAREALQLGNTLVDEEDESGMLAG